MSAESIQIVLGTVQTVILVGGFIYTYRALREANDSRNIDFIIQAEGQIDPLFEAMLEESPDILRAVLPNLFPAGADDLTIRRYVYTYFAYRHLSRIIYMLGNPAISLGMSPEQRTEFVDDWLNELKKYDQATVRELHAYCRTTGEFNELFIRNMDELYGFAPPSL